MLYAYGSVRSFAVRESRATKRHSFPRYREARRGANRAINRAICEPNRTANVAEQLVVVIKIITPHVHEELPSNAPARTRIPPKSPFFVDGGSTPREHMERRWIGGNAARQFAARPSPCPIVNGSLNPKFERFALKRWTLNPSAGRQNTTGTSLAVCFSRLKRERAEN